jgi:hypothetical protein
MGRRSRRDNLSNIVVTVRLTPDENDALEALAHRYNVTSRSDALRVVLGLATADHDPILLRDPMRRLALRYAGVAQRPLAEGEILLNRDELSDPGLAEALTPDLTRFVVAHVQYHGWPMPPCGQTTAQTLADVRSNTVPGPIYSGRGRTGIDFLKSRFPSYWQTFRGPYETLSDPPRLQRLLRHMLGLSAAARPVDFTWANFRRAFSEQHIVVSFFRPAVAAGIYARWLDGHTAPVVWDPSAGFGARMLGFFAMFPHGTYFANEPAALTHLNLCTLAQEMPGMSRIEQAGSEFASWEPGTLDLVFTSPPYFDTERYFNAPGQVWVEYKTRAVWQERQVIPTLRAAFVGLKPGAYAVININQMHRDVYLQSALAVGFQFVTEEELTLNRSALAQAVSHNNPSAVQSEPVLVFRRP